MDIIIMIFVIYHLYLLILFSPTILTKKISILIFKLGYPFLYIYSYFAYLIIKKSDKNYIYYYPTFKDFLRYISK